MTSHAIPNVPAARISAESAFVVHLAGSASDTPDEIRGRIEHVSSGRSMQFASSAELIGFMQAIVSEADSSMTCSRTGIHD